MPRAATDGAATAPWRGYFLIAAATAAAYLNSFGGVFQFDDWAVIVEDARVHSLAAWWASMPGIRPVLKLSYALNWQSGLGLAGFHAFNLIVHVVNGGLVFTLLRRLAARTLVATAGGVGSLAALVAALLFTLLPVQTEAVTYVSGRSASLAALLALASLLAWDVARDASTPGLRRIGLWITSVALFLIGLGVKETVLVVPFALALLALCEARQRVRWRDAFVATAPHALALLAAGVAAASLPRYWLLLESSFTARDLAVNLLTQLHAVAYLIGQIFMPWRLNADPQLPEVAAWTFATMALALAYATALAAGFASVRSRPALAFGILWFFLWLAPTNSLLPRLDLVNDRQLYMALMGPAWLAGCLAARLASVAATRGRALRSTLGVAGIAVLVLASASTARRNLVYASEIAFWCDVAQKSPANPRAAANLGYAYAIAGRPSQAEAEFRRALALDPQYTRATINLMLLQDGSLGKQ